MPTPITILHVVIALNPGGMEKVLVRVAQHLTPRGFDVHVCCLEEPGELAPLLPVPANVHALRKPPGKSPATVFRLRRLIQEVRPDLIHTHNLGPLLYTVPATLLARSVPLLHGEHAQLIDSDLSSSRLALRRWLYRACRRVHTVSAGLRDQLLQLRLAPAQSITAVINGVDTDEYAPGDRAAARRALGLPQDAVVLGVVARLRASKRHGLLLEALTRLRSRWPNLHLLIAGDGPERNRLEEAARSAGIADRTHFPGQIPDPRPCYHAMDLVVMPSRAEGLSNAVLEAMACGVPVLAHRACGNAEAITHEVDGWICDLDTGEEIAARLTAILRSPAAVAAAGRAARAKVEKQFRFETTVDNYERLYRELLDGVRAEG